MAPRAAEGREANVPCQRKTAEDTGTRETNASEEGAAAVRRDGGPLTIANQQLRQEDSAASRPPSRTRRGATTEAAPQTADPDPGEGTKTGGCRSNIIDIFPCRNTSKPGQQEWLSQLQEMSETPADPDAERGVRVFQSG